MTAQELPFGLSKQPLAPEAHEFDYAALDSETRIVVQQRTSEIKKRLKDIAQAIWEIGQKLIDVKNYLEYGQFNSWLLAEFKWSRRTAYNYINVFKSFGSCQDFGQLNIATSALYLLAAPSTPEEARAEALKYAYQGKPITYTKAKTIVSKHKDSAKPKVTKPVTVNVSVETVERESSAQTAQTLENAPTGADQAEAELLAEETPQSEADDFEVGKDICTMLINNVQYLSNNQIDAVWQAIAHRIPSGSLGLHNWPDAELKRLIEDASRELNSRHHPEYSNSTPAAQD